MAKIYICNCDGYKHFATDRYTEFYCTAYGIGLGHYAKCSDCDYAGDVYEDSKWD